MATIPLSTAANPLIGVDMAHFAILKSDPIFKGDATDDPLYTDPMPLSNTRGINVTSADATTTEFYDNAPKFTVASKSDRTIAFTRASFNNSERRALLGLGVDEDGITIEGGKSAPPYIAFGFRREKRTQAGQTAYDYIWYLKGVMYQNEDNIETRQQTVALQNRVMNGTFIARQCDDQIVITASTDDASIPQTVFDNWFTADTLNKLYVAAV